jgi:hypothetical protein
MLELNNTFTKADLISSFEKVHHEVATYFLSLPRDSFFKSPSGKWSPAENLLHLVKSVKPVAMAMKMPCGVLKILFGKPQAASRRFEQIKETYQRTLANGGKAAGRFIPSIQETPLHPDQFRNNLVQKWNATGESLLAVLRNWKDENLDNYLLPHPLLGKLTIREMLFFTLYHDLHHVNNVRKLLGN